MECECAPSLDKFSSPGYSIHTFPIGFNNLLSEVFCAAFSLIANAACISHCSIIQNSLRAWNFCLDKCYMYTSLSIQIIVKFFWNSCTWRVSQFEFSHSHCELRIRISSISKMLIYSTSLNYGNFKTVLAFELYMRFCFRLSNSEPGRKIQAALILNREMLHRQRSTGAFYGFICHHLHGLNSLS